jgi:hypothetical protein
MTDDHPLTFGVSHPLNLGTPVATVCDHLAMPSIAIVPETSGRIAITEICKVNGKILTIKRHEGSANSQLGKAGSLSRTAIDLPSERNLNVSGNSIAKLSDVDMPRSETRRGRWNMSGTRSKKERKGGEAAI